MARYFMHLRGGTDELRDTEGRDFPNLDALRDAVLFTARDLLTGDVRTGTLDLRFRIEAEDEGGEIVYAMPFGHAVSIVTECSEAPDRQAARCTR